MAQDIKDDDIEYGAKALAAFWGDNWFCVCSDNKGLNCDCGDALTEEREGRHDDQMSRTDYRNAAKAVLTSTKGFA